MENDNNSKKYLGFLAGIILGLPLFFLYVYNYSSADFSIFGVTLKKIELSQDFELNLANENQPDFKKKQAYS